MHLWLQHNIWRYSHLDVQLDAFLLVAVDLPHTVQSFGVALGPVRRQDGTGGLGQLSSTQSFNEQNKSTEVRMLRLLQWWNNKRNWNKESNWRRKKIKRLQALHRKYTSFLLQIKQMNYWITLKLFLDNKHSNLWRDTTQTARKVCQ